MSDYRTRTLQRDHLVVRPEHVLCTKCFTTEPVTCGHGTPMGTLIIAFDQLAARHQDCAQGKKK